MRAVRERPELTLRPNRPVYYTLSSRSLKALSAADLRPTARGVAIRREYLDEEGAPLRGPVPAGALVRVRLMVHVEAGQLYVAVDEPLPAGLEPIDPRLAITGPPRRGVALPAGVRDGRGAFNHVELRDERVMFFADALPAGTWALTYDARATSRGEFVAPPARVHPMYQPEVYGETAVSVLEVR